MAQEIVLTAKPREDRGRNEARKLRATGMLPGVIYGAGIQSQALSVPRSDLLKVMHAHGAHPLVTVKLDGGQEYLALIKELQVDPVRQLALHVDFHRVQEDVAVQTQVEINVVGTPAGVKVGGVLEVVTRIVAIEALPRALPESLDLDVSGLEIGSVARVADLTPPPGVTILTDPDETLCSVVAPRVEEPTLSPEEMEALAALTPEELEDLKEIGAAVPEGEEVPAEGEEPAEAAEGEESGEAS